jgi:general stress protein CsbA
MAFTFFIAFMLAISIVLGFISLDQGSVGRLVCALLSFILIGVCVFVSNKLGYVSDDYVIQFLRVSLTFFIVMFGLTAVSVLLRRIL